MARFTNSKGEPISDREGLRGVVKEQFYKLGQIIDGAKSAENAYRTELKKIEGYSKDYNQDYIAAQNAKAESAYKAKRQELYNDAQKQIEALGNTLSELHGALDLSDPALRNAADLIKNVGPGLEVENKLKINARFAGDQPALRVLRDAYKAAGTSNAGLDDQIYNPDEAIQRLGRHAQYALVQGDESVFKWGVECGRVAKLEGLDFIKDFPQGEPFPSQHQASPEVDKAAESKMMAAVRKAAGLPPAPEEPKAPEGK
jgi:hypothetical protein